MKLHIPIQILLDPDNDGPETSDFGVQAAMRHSLSKIAIKNVGPKPQGDSTKFISKSAVGQGGFKTIFKPQTALDLGPGRTEKPRYYDYVLAKVNKFSKSLFAEVVCEMVATGSTKRTFYVSFDKTKNRKVMLYLPLIKGSSDSSYSGKQGAIAFLHHFKQLKQLHLGGFCHNDVKRENYMFDRGTNKGTLIDFGTMSRPWQHDFAVVTTGWTFPNNIVISGIDDEFVSEIAKVFPNGVSVWQSELRKEDVSYMSIKTALKDVKHDWARIVPMFGVHYDNAGLLRYGIDNCKILDVAEAECQEAVKALFHPSAMVAVANALIERYKLSKEELQCFDITPIAHCDAPAVRINPKEAQLNRENLSRALDQYAKGENLTIADGFYAGAVIKPDQRTIKNRSEIESVERKKYGLRKKDIERFDEYQEHRQNDLDRSDDEDWLFDEWYREEKGIPHTVYSGFKRQVRLATDTHKDKPIGRFLEALETMLSQNAVDQRQLAALLTRIFVVASIDSNGKASPSPVLFRNIFMTLGLQGKDFLQKYWDPNIRDVKNATDFFQMLTQSTSGHPAYQPLFSRAYSTQEQALQSMKSGVALELRLEQAFDWSGTQWARLGKGGYNHGKWIATGGGELSREQMNEAITHEATKIDVNVDVSDVTLGVKEMFNRLFSKEVVKGINEYFHDIAVAYANSLI